MKPHYTITFKMDGVAVTDPSERVILETTLSDRKKILAQISQVARVKFFTYSVARDFSPRVSAPTEQKPRKRKNAPEPDVHDDALHLGDDHEDGRNPKEDDSGVEV